MFLRLVPLLLVLPLAAFSQGSLSEPVRTGEHPVPSRETALLAGPGTKAASVPPLAAAEASQLLAAGKGIVLDVRTPEEFAAGHLQGARNINFRAPDFQEQVARLDPNATYLVYCASGNRSGMAAAAMQQKGFKKVSNAGGYKQLKEAGAK